MIINEIDKKLLSIVTPTYNEEECIENLYSEIKNITNSLTDYKFEIIVIDNNSSDNTQKILKELALKDKDFKVILNNRNFGHIRSPYYGILQASGEAVIYMASDFQDPPELIPKFIEQWNQGFKLVMATKKHSKESAMFNFFRRLYYRLLNKVSDISVIKDSTGFGLYDKEVIDELKKIKDPYPFTRGLICDLGYEYSTVNFVQPTRKRGFTKNNFFTLYDIGMLGIISHSKFPIRFAAFIGFLVGGLSFLIGAIYLIMKLILWDSFPMGIAPLIIGLFFFIGLQFIFIGIIGEYIGSIHTYSQNRPLVVEKERINFRKSNDSN